MSEQSKHCNTYSEMNEKIVEYLRISDAPIDLYAAQRIVELEEQLKQDKLAHKLARTESELTKMTIAHDSLLEQLEQAQAANLELERDVEEIRDERDELHGKLLDREERLGQSYWAREGLIERLNEQNQKLIEALELLKTWDLNNLNKANVRKVVNEALKEVKG
ncbi:MAG TPA: hypothetical protein IAA29_00655 [Candidatus Paenibacillus intestinavium]|nr:hypothetical protein [Candidatus Paenibacillus intestinavium]